MGERACVYDNRSPGATQNLGSRVHTQAAARSLGTDLKAKPAAAATNVKTFKIYRYNPDKNEKPYMRCGRGPVQRARVPLFFLLPDQCIRCRLPLQHAPPSCRLLRYCQCSTAAYVHWPARCVPRVCPLRSSLLSRPVCSVAAPFR